MRRVLGIAGLCLLLPLVVVGSLARPSPAAEGDLYVEPNGLWHVDGEAFWFGAPGDVFLTGPALGFGGGEGATDYAVWRNGEVHWGGEVVDGVRETVRVEPMGLPSDVPVVIAFHFGSPSTIGYIRDNVVYYSDGQEVTGWANPDIRGAPGVSLVPRPPIRVPHGQLRQQLAGTMGHALLAWPLLLDGNYPCATEGPGDVLVPQHTVLEEGGRLTLCVGDDLIVEDSTLRGFRIDGPVKLRGESDLEDMSVHLGGITVESGIARIVRYSDIQGVVEVEPGAQLRLDESDVAVGSSNAPFPAAIVVKTTEPVVLVQSFLGWHPYRSPVRLGTINVPDGYGPANVTLLDTRTAPLDIPVSCLDLYHDHCSQIP